jgi:hypothetical protein
MGKRSGSLACGGGAAANGRRTGRRIDYSDISESSPEQLHVMRRVGRPPIGERARQLIPIRVDPGVHEKFRKEARRRRGGLPDSSTKSSRGTSAGTSRRSATVRAIRLAFGVYRE